jgi:hypothetical protein
MSRDWLFCGSKAPFADIKRFKPYWSDFEAARREHAFLLCCEGLNNYEINRRVGGLSELYMDEWISEFVRRLNRGIRKASWTVMR